MDEAEFDRRADALFQQIEAACDAAPWHDPAHGDCEREGNRVLTLRFSADNTIVLSQQAASQEIWLVASLQEEMLVGHYHYDAQGVWRDRHNQDGLLSDLNQMLRRFVSDPRWAISDADLALSPEQA